MIENAVASTLMRLPVAELSALRKVSERTYTLYARQHTHVCCFRFEDCEYMQYLSRSPSTLFGRFLSHAGKEQLCIRLFLYDQVGKCPNKRNSCQTSRSSSRFLERQRHNTHVNPKIDHVERRPFAAQKVFMASPGGLSLEGFVAAILPPTLNDAKGQSQPLLQRQGSARFRRLSATKARAMSEPRLRSPSTADVKPVVVGGQSRKKRKPRRKRSSGRGRRRAGGAKSLLNQAGWAEREGGGAGWSLSEEERIGVVTDLVELFQQVDHNGDQVRDNPPARVRSFPHVVVCLPVFSKAVVNLLCA